MGRGEEREGNKPQEILNDREQTVLPEGGRGDGLDGGWARWVMGTKEGTCQDEHWVLYVSDESLGSTPETNTTLYVN